MISPPVTTRRDASDVLSSHVSSTVASHRSFASQVPSSTQTSGRGAEYYATGPDTADSFIPPHVNKPAETIDDEWAKMPFVMPDDEEIFRIRGLEKKRKEQKKLDNMLPVAEKTTFASRMAATVASDSLKEALRKSEEMLVEDTAQFEAFLKQNDEKVQEALKKAEQQTKLKQDKLADIKRLNSSMATIKKDLNKFQEQLDECKKYKDFILSLTPKDWLDANSHMQGEHLKKKNDRKETSDMVFGGDIAVNDVVGEEVDIVEEMYFQSPNQLLEIFRELEEKNLLLMQESQDIETCLEDIKSRFNDAKVKNESKIMSLQSQLQAIKVAIKTEEERQSNLQTKTNVNMVDKKYDVSFEEMATKVSEVYVRCGLEDDPSLGTLQKLTSIEAKLEESIFALEGVPLEFIEQTEKAREKQRRLALREEKMEKQRMEQEKRAERSLERAHAPIPRKTGKPVMFRSRLFKKKKLQVAEVKTDDDRELIEFLEHDY